MAIGVEAAAPDMRSVPARRSTTFDRRALIAVLGLAAALPLLVGAALDAAHGWLPAGDYATVLLRSRDVLTSHSPLVGQYSQTSWYAGHALYVPGPSMYWLLALPAQAMSWWPAAPLVWMALAEAVVVVAIVWLAERQGGNALAVLTSLGIVALMLSMGPRTLYAPWNAYAPILPLVLLTFATWAVVTGSHRLFPLVCLVASFELQSDPAFMLVTVALSMVAFGAVVLGRWRLREATPAERRRAGLGWPTAVLSVVVLVAMWLPAVVQQLTTSPGNLTVWWRASRAHPAREGVAFGLAIVGKAVGIVPLWFVNRWIDVSIAPGSPATSTTIASGVLVFVVLAALLIVAIRARVPRVGSGLAVCLVLTAALAVAAAYIPHDGLSVGSWWLLYWSRAIGMTVWVIAAWALWRVGHQWLSANRYGIGLPVIDPPLQQRLVLGAGAGVVLISLLVAVFGQRSDDQRWSYPVIRRATAAIEDLHDRGPHAVAVGFFDYVPLIVGQGLVLQLHLDGQPVGADNGFWQSLGPRFRLPAGGVVPEVYVTSDPKLSRNRVPTTAVARTLVKMPVDMVANGRPVVVTVLLVPPAR